MKDYYKFYFIDCLILVLFCEQTQFFVCKLKLSNIYLKSSLGYKVIFSIVTIIHVYVFHVYFECRMKINRGVVLRKGQKNVQRGYLISELINIEYFLNKKKTQ